MVQWYHPMKQLFEDEFSENERILCRSPRLILQRSFL